MYVFKRLRVLAPLSHSQDVTGKTQAIFNRTNMFRKTSPSQSLIAEARDFGRDSFGLLRYRTFQREISEAINSGEGLVVLIDDVVTVQITITNYCRNQANNTSKAERCNFAVIPSK